MTTLPNFLVGEPESLIKEADKLPLLLEAVSQLEKIGAHPGLIKMVQKINETAFVTGVLFERAAAEKELEEIGLCFRDDHVVDGKILCATEGAGPCNGYPRPQTHTHDDACDHKV